MKSFWDFSSYMKDKRFKKELQALGLRLQRERKQANLSQLDLEIRTGMNRTEISKIENGLKNIEFSTLVKLAEGLGVELIVLFKD
jgi:HTH-type transcriptional regulator, competence development regulator